MILPGDHLAVFQGDREGLLTFSEYRLSGISWAKLCGSGKHSVTGINILRIANGKIVEQWGQFDALGLMQQPGVAPVQGQAS